MLIRRWPYSRRSGPRPPIVIALVAARSTLGAIELVLPAVTQWPDTGFDRRAALAVRLLGSRQLGQALLMYIAPDARVAATGAAVDGIHGASMLALAIRSSRWRRAALTEAVVATGLAAVGVSLARSLPYQA